MTEEFGTEVTELANTVKTTADAIKAVEETGTGKFVGRVFGGMLENGLGMVGDAIKFKRIELYERHVQKTKDNLKERGIDWERDELKTVKPKVAIPVFENASLEDDDDLHTLWSNLLANAMDPNYRSDIKSVHIAIVKDLDATDVKLLRDCYEQTKLISRPYDDILFDKLKVASKLHLSEENIEISLLNLMRLGCIKPGNVITKGLSFGGGMHNTVYKGTDQFNMSKLGASLCKAAIK
jgi:hypothetical protein